MSLDEVGVGDVEGGFAEGVAVDVLRFYGCDVARVSGYLADGFGLVDGREVVVDLLGDVPEWMSRYPV